MNILHIITRADWGGAQRVVKMLTEHTEANTSVACGTGGRLVAELEQNGTRVFKIPELKSEPDLMSDLNSLYKIVKIILGNNIDVVHCHSTKSGLLGRVAAAATRTPSVFTVHGWGFYNNEYKSVKSLLIGGERLLARVTDKLVCVSENDMKNGIKNEIIGPSEGTVIHNGVPHIQDTDSRSRLADISGIDTSLPVIGTLCRLEPQKDPISFLEIVHRLSDLGEEFQAVMIGDGSLRQDCDRYINKHNLSNVNLLGFRKDALELLFDFDLFLLTSKFEGLPLTVLESMHSGVPVIAYDVGGVSEAIETNITGEIIENRDINEFAKRVSDILCDEEKRSKMSSRAKRRAQQYFSAKRMAKEYAELYNHI